jgi:hypothetical protein
VGGWWCAARSARVAVGEWQKGHQGSRSASEKPTSKVTSARVSQHQTSASGQPPPGNPHGQSSMAKVNGQTCTTYNVLPSDRRGRRPPSQGVSSSSSQGQGRVGVCIPVVSFGLSPSYRVINCVGTAIAMTSGRGCCCCCCPPPATFGSAHGGLRRYALPEGTPGMGMSSARSGQ